jgi:hypothetical protein
LPHSGQASKRGLYGHSTAKWLPFSYRVLLDTARWIELAD